MDEFIYIDRRCQILIDEIATDIINLPYLPTNYE